MYLIEREILEEVLDLIDPPHCNNRERICPLDIVSDVEFRRRFRFTRSTFYKLVRMIDQDLAPETQRSCPLTTAQQLAIFTCALGSNEHQSLIAGSFNCSQATVSRIMRNVSDWFTTNARRFIAWPNQRQRKEIEERIFQNTGIPNIIGAIDGCRIKIRVPADDRLRYVDQSGNTSINVGAVVDDCLRFLWVSADAPGETENSSVFENSKLYSSMRNGRTHGRLVADEEYGDEDFLVKPLVGDYLGESASSSNEAIRNFHVGVQEAFKRMKKQFGAVESGLRYGPERAPSVIIAAACLYNASIMFNEPQDDYESKSEGDSRSSNGSGISEEEEPLFL